MARNRIVRRVDSLMDEFEAMERNIMSRAYELFCERGREAGRVLDDWVAAEREMAWKPAVALREIDGHFVVTAVLAGIDAKELDVRVTAEDVLIKARRQCEKPLDDGVRFSEFQPGQLFRDIRLPAPIDPDAVEAKFKNGLLTVTAPKAHPPKSTPVAAT